MEDFITTVEDEHLQELLWVAIEGRGAFRRFKSVLANHPRERERWFEFKDRRLPIVLWPQVLAHVPVPEDVDRDLIQPLLEDGITEPVGAQLVEWPYEWEADGRCNRCQRAGVVLALGEELTLCAGCLRQGASLLDLCEAYEQGRPWRFEVQTDYSAGPVTWDDVYDGNGHFLFTLYARGAPVDPAESEAGVYDRPGYYPFGYSDLEAGDGYPDIVAEAETLSVAQVAEACRLWLKAHGLPADDPLVVVHGPEEFTFPAPGVEPAVTHHREERG